MSFKDFGVPELIILSSCVIFPILITLAIIAINRKRKIEKDMKSAHDLQTAPIPAQVIAPDAPKANKSLGHLLFSAKGRISRSTFWYYHLSLFGLIFLAVIADGQFLTQASNSLYGFFTSSLLLLNLITSTFVYIKRCHDLDWSGWRALWAFVPLAFLVLLPYWGFEKGTVGPNYYGPDPTQ